MMVLVVQTCSSHCYRKAICRLRLFFVSFHKGFDLEYENAYTIIKIKILIKPYPEMM